MARHDFALCGRSTPPSSADEWTSRSSLGHQRSLLTGVQKCPGSAEERCVRPAAAHGMAGRSMKLPASGRSTLPRDGAALPFVHLREGACGAHKRPQVPLTATTDEEERAGQRSAGRLPNRGAVTQSRGAAGAQSSGSERTPMRSDGKWTRRQESTSRLQQSGWDRTVDPPLDAVRRSQTARLPQSSACPEQGRAGGPLSTVRD